ncbi:MAG: hypothetical protein GF331_15785 [Chitinivibrionales bacterium]|nr:hypothetical protein [Chitinivibrionales bacterium]
MQQKIQELADKLYQEGVQKGEQKSEEIIKSARERADKEIADAKAQAEQIRADARKEAEEMRHNIESDIKLSGQQALSVVKKSILDSITADVVDSAVNTTFSDPSFVADLVKTIVSKWDTQSAQAPSFEVLLPESKRKEVEKAIKKDVSDKLSKGLTVQFSQAIKGGLQIGRADSGFKVSLTDDDFVEFFKEYLRPKTRAFLFGEQSA